MDNETKWGETYFCTRSLVIARSSALNGPQEHSELKVWRASEDLCNCIIHKPMGLLIKVLLHISHSSCCLECAGCWSAKKLYVQKGSKETAIISQKHPSFMLRIHQFPSIFSELIFNTCIQQLLRLYKKMTFLLTKQWSSYILPMQL